MSAGTNPWTPGGKVGRYVLVAPLAAGGMAEIWLARQPGVHGFEKIVCIKRMIGALQDDPDHVAMFLTEARLAAGLSHRHVVQIYELGEDHGSLYIAMEFIEGESLSRVYKRARQLKEHVPIEIAVQLVAWAAEGLQYAHTLVASDGTPRGLVHRDVSPQNLIVTADGSIKLVDFGIAKVATDETASGKLKGKLTYMAPEQARAESLDARADVFALGVVLFELLAGSRLFGKVEEVEILGRLVSEQPLPRVSERRPEVPKDLDDLLAHAMAPHRDDRLGSARAFEEGLERFLQERSLRVSSGDIAAYLNRLFPGRAAERHAMLEAARKGDVVAAQSASSLFHAHTPGASRDGSGSNTHSGVKKDPFGAPTPSKNLAPLAVLVGFALLGLGGAAILTSTRTPETPVVTAPTVPPVGTLNVECKPKATLLIDDEVRGTTPYAVDDLALGEHRVVLRAPGYAEQERTVTVKTAGQVLSLELSLEKEAPVAAVEPVDAGVGGSAKPEVAARQTGKLNLRTTPWTTVYLGKRKLGDTPLVGVTLPAGNQVLRVVNAEAGLQSTIEVTIQANRTVNENLVLR